MKELVDPNTVERALRLLAVGGPLLGLILGALVGARRKNALSGMVAGALLGGVLALIYAMWRLYGLITDRFGLDSVANLGLQLVLFAVLGGMLGVVVLKVSMLLKRWATD